MADRHHSMHGQPCNARHGTEGHLPAQRQHQRLEQLSEARELPGPLRFYLPYASVRQLDPRYPHLKMAFVLEEVQMPIALLHRVVYRVYPRFSSNGEAATRLKAHPNLQQPLRHIKIRTCYVPRCADTQRRPEQPVTRHALPSEITLLLLSDSPLRIQ